MQLRTYQCCVLADIAIRADVALDKAKALKSAWIPSANAHSGGNWEYHVTVADTGFCLSIEDAIQGSLQNACSKIQVSPAKYLSRDQLLQTKFQAEA